ncbi:hypothetical protein [Streptomonospora litoralis]|uniref:Uncharacterized protein n=1 Tax=Streptomonospora litoralis TaxID=2498135 RepID=A0A4P6Q8C5_9ACTN|nr:hypothetical protein [Streptomonospora litoralis]QBI56690.1 hypothetical protein EKD16_24740 [Streptomonospora litoralis]
MSDHLLAERLQVAANRHAGRFGVAFGACVVLVLTSLAALVPSSVGLWPWVPLTVLIGLAGGAVFVMIVRDGGLAVPPETDPARLRAARRALRRGEPGGDPEVNRLAVEKAQKVLQQRAPGRWFVAVNTVGLVATTAAIGWSLLSSQTEPLFGPAGAAFCCLLNLVQLPLTTRKRRRARWIVEACEGGAEGLDTRDHRG